MHSAKLDISAVIHYQLVIMNSTSLRTISTISSPRVIERASSRNSTYRPVVHLASTANRDAEFQLSNDASPTPDALGKLFFPASFLDNLANSSNEYARARIPQQTELPYKITARSLCQFIGIILYSGVAKLPAKADYWSNNDVLPSHNVTRGMSARTFEYIWRNIHYRGATHAPGTTTPTTALQPDQENQPNNEAAS